MEENCRLNNRSRMRRESHVRICEGLRGQFPRPTRLVVHHECLDIVLKAKSFINEWLGNIGLGLKPSKTRLCHTLESFEENEPGFNFLGFNVRQYRKKTRKCGWILLIKPSKDAVKKHLYKLKTTIQGLRSVKQEALIMKLNPIINGWTNYYKHVVSKLIFSKVSFDMGFKLWKWAKFRHPKKNVKWIKSKYFRKHGNDICYFKTPQGYTLRKHHERSIQRFIKVRGTRSIYDGDFVYWATRMGRYHGLYHNVAELLKIQKGKCGHCNLYLKSEDQTEIHHKDKNHKNNAKSNLVLLHTHCHHFIHGRGMNDKHQMIEEPDDMETVMSGFEAEYGG